MAPTFGPNRFEYVKFEFVPIIDCLRIRSAVRLTGISGIKPSSDLTPFLSRPILGRSPPNNTENDIGLLVSSFLETPSRRLAPKEFKEYVKNMKSPVDKPVRCLNNIFFLNNTLM